MVIYALKMVDLPIKNGDLPINSMVDLSIVFCMFTRPGIPNKPGSFLPPKINYFDWAIFNSFVSLPEGIWENMMILHGKWGIAAQSIGLEVSFSFRGVPPCIIQVMDYHFIIKTYGDLGIPPIKKTYPYHPIHSQQVSHSDLTSTL